MILTLDELSAIYEEQLFFEITVQDQSRMATYVLRQHYPSNIAYENAQLNWLCREKWLQFIRSEPDLDHITELGPNSEALPWLWSVVNGTEFTLGKTRFILIPIQTSEMTEFRVQREWIDLPQWAGHHLIALQVDLDAGWIQVWGSATHQDFREYANYEPIDETYSLALEELTEDLSVLWVVQELLPAPSLFVQQPTPIHTEKIERLIQRLGQRYDYPTRLEVPFEQWATIMNEPHQLQKLYQRSLELEKLRAESQADGFTESLGPVVSFGLTNLGQWFQHSFEQGWQSFDEILSSTEGSMAFAFRHTQAHPREIAVEGVKLIDLEMQLGQQPVALIIGLSESFQERIGVQVQLLPTQTQPYLPTGIRLTLLSVTGEYLQESVARQQDNLIQLKRFSCREGKGFRIQVSWGEFGVTEAFEIRPAISE